MKDAIRTHFATRWQTFYERYLPGLKKIGSDEYQALCPFHEDTNPSLNVSGQTGKYYCHSCGKGGDPFHFYAKVNSLNTGRDFGKILAGIARDFGLENGRRERRIVATYNYVNAQGELIFQTVRFEPKDFSQRRPAGNGKWTWNLKGIEPVLYRIPEVIRADKVLVVEGEKDADNLSNLGFMATTSPMGAKKWRPEYSDSLKDKDVVLIPDNDLPGREHMAKVGASLVGKARTIRLLELPGLPSGGDVSDFVAGFNGDMDAARERLSIMIENAPAYDPPRPKTIEDAILEAASFTAIELPHKKPFLPPWLLEQTISQITGWRGVGKSWFAMSLVDAVTRGADFGPWQAGEPVPCLYLEGEMPTADVSERFKVLNPQNDRKAPLYIYADAYANHLGLTRANLVSETWRQSMKRILMTRHVKLWVIDNLASLCPGIDENKKQDWDPVNQWLLELRFAGISTIFLHHVNKAGDQRGTSAREDNIDAAVMLKTPHDYVPEDGARFVCTFRKARVRTADLPLIQDTQFHLKEDEAGRLVWAWGNVRRETKAEVLRMLNDGADHKTICEALGITRGRVSQVRTKAVKDGHLTKAGKLTQAGFMAVNVDE